MIDKKILDKAVRMNILRMLEDRKINQAKLADLCGIKPSNLSRTMTGKLGISDEFLTAVSKALGYSKKQMLIIPEGLVNEALRQAWNTLLEIEDINPEYVITTCNLLKTMQRLHDKNPQAARALSDELNAKNRLIESVIN